MSDAAKKWIEHQDEILPEPVEDLISGALIVVFVLASPVLICLLPVWAIGRLWRKLVIEKQEEPKE
jgi:hypothetical protein